MSGNHTVTTVDNARAVCELIKGLFLHLQKRNLIPSDLSLVYRYTTDPNPSDLDLLAVDIRQSARASSNFAKHADRDADKTHVFDGSTGCDMLVFNMIQDYETLHCAMISADLLDDENEKVYPVERKLLIDFHQYKRIYHPYFRSERDTPDESTFTGIVMGSILRSQLYDDKEYAYLPAGAAACVYAQTNFLMFTSFDRAEKMRELKIWPFNVENNSRIKRELISTPKVDPEAHTPTDI